MLTEGTVAPNFSLLDHTSKTRNLTEFLNNWLVLFIFPEDNAENVLKSKTFKKCKEFTRNCGISIIGISSSTNKVIRNEFPNENLILLSDPEYNTIKKYTHIQNTSKQSIQRVSYLIDPTGIIAKVYKDTDLTYNSQELFQDIKNLLLINPYVDTKPISKIQYSRSLHT